MKQAHKYSITVLVLLTAVSIPVWRASISRATVQAPGTSALPVVAVARVNREDLFNEVTIPAEFRPYTEVNLHAKVSGYVQQISVDIGDRVKAGQLLATLEVPELRDEVDRASAAQKKAEADYRDAHLVFSRLEAVNRDHPGLVAQQDLDTAEAKEHSLEAGLAGAKAEVQRIKTLLGYAVITAPFDGVVTRRFADPGALIQAGTASQTQTLPLVRLSDNYHLRLDFPVSVAYVKDVRQGDPVEVRVQSLNGRQFTGAISRFSQRVDDDTRTMLTEIEVPNPQLELVPGMYAEVVLKVEKRLGVLAIPIEAVSSEQKTTVYVINSRQEMEERAVSIGLQTATRYEVTGGLKEGDLVLVGSHPGLNPGQKVEAKLTGSSKP